MKYVIFDLETYTNIFTFCGFDYQTKQWFLYEISERKDQKQELLQFLNYHMAVGTYFVGYNNCNFDYPILHSLILDPLNFTYQRASQLCQQIIFDKENTQPIWADNRRLKQIDLLKINHFDNKNRATSLKALQCAMRSESVEDLPFPVRNLTFDEMDTLIKYNAHDVLETIKFFEKCIHLIDLRKEMLDTKMIEGDVLNYSDVKIGVEFLIKEIGRDKCFGKDRQPLQTKIQSLELKNIILPKIEFHLDEYDAVKDWYKKQTWYSYQENEIKLETTIRGFPFVLGMGGIHGSVENEAFIANDDWVIIDLDVASLYPSIGIANNFYPMHLGEMFVEKYKGLKDKRFQQAKGTALNALYKLALNGAYGNSNNPYSPLYDPSYMLKITINGQLQLLQLCELLFSVPNVKPIQVNTDGVTIYVHKSSIPYINMHITGWQKDTGLELEQADYSRMFIRDVNNYLAVTTKGKIKAKGAYWHPETDKDHDGYWNKDYSAMVVQKAIRHVLMDGINPEYIVKLMTDPFDFMLRYKTPSGSQIYLGDEPCSKTVRYYVSTKGKEMVKVSKPKGVVGEWKRRNGLSDSEFNRINSIVPKGTWDERIHTKNKSQYGEVRTNIENGKLVKLCNNCNDFNWNDVDYNYYIKEVEKLIICTTEKKDS
jgi:hypothetical protein